MFTPQTALVYAKTLPRANRMTVRLPRLHDAKLHVADVQFQRSFGGPEKALRRIGQGHVQFSGTIRGRLQKPSLKETLYGQGAVFRGINQGDPGPGGASDCILGQRVMGATKHQRVDVL